MSMNRSKQIRAGQKSIYSSTAPITSHVPIIYSSTSQVIPELPVTSSQIQDLTKTANDTNAHTSGLFSNDEEKVQSAEAVRVLQNIFQQKRDLMPTVSSIESLASSEISHDLNSIINATACSLNESSPTDSNHSPKAMEDLNQKNPESPEKMDLTPSPISGSSRSAFSPPNKFSSKSSALESMITTEPLSINSNSKGSTATDEENANSPVNVTTNKDCPENILPMVSQEPKIKEEAVEATEGNSIISAETPKIYPPASQDIIDQLNSLTASGIGNIQNLANSISNTFSETNLTEGSLGNLSSLSMESLASSLNLSMANVTGLEEQSNPSSRVNVGSGVYSGSGKLDFLSRLEGDSPSMLSMMGNQSCRPSPANTTAPNPGTNQLIFFFLNSTDLSLYIPINNYFRSFYVRLYFFH